MIRTIRRRVRKVRICLTLTTKKYSTKQIVSYDKKKQKSSKSNRAMAHFYGKKTLTKILRKCRYFDSQPNYHRVLRFVGYYGSNFEIFQNKNFIIKGFVKCVLTVDFSKNLLQVGYLLDL